MSLKDTEDETETDTEGGRQIWEVFAYTAGNLSLVYWEHEHPPPSPNEKKVLVVYMYVGVPMILIG